MRKFLYIIPAMSCLLLAGCEDLTLTCDGGDQPADVSGQPAVSLRAEQSAGNVVKVTLTKGGGFTTREIFAESSRPVTEEQTISLFTDNVRLLEEYSARTGIEYKMLPEPFFSFTGGSTLDFHEGMQNTASRQLRLFAVNPLDNVLEPGRYLLPISGRSLWQELSDSTVFVDITVRAPYTDPDGYELYTGEDMFTVFYLNTSAFDPRLANDMILQFLSTNERRGLGNIVNLRTASVGYDAQTDKVSVVPSNDLRYILDHYTERALPVQESGRKLCICIEGGGKGIGFANFTDAQISDFAASVKRLVETYGLDGINLWDRNTGYERAEQNGFQPMNTTSYPKMLKTLREVLGPHKLITVADYEEPTEYFHDVEAMGGLRPGDYIDYAWSGYCDSKEPLQIVDPWHQGLEPVSTVHPRLPIAGLSPKRYGCIHTTWYRGADSQIPEQIIPLWVNNGYSQNGITVYYDIRSIIQDQYESTFNNPGNLLKCFPGMNQVQIDLLRLTNKRSESNPNGSAYNKWVKDW